MALFGRDSLLTVATWPCRSTRPRPGHAADAGRAARAPRSIPTPRRSPGASCTRCGSGVTAGLALGGGSAYYGTADATPLFVVLLGELRRWGVHRDDVDAPAAPRRSGAGLDRDYGDRDGDGFVEYAAGQRPRPGQPGLEGLLGRRSTSPTARLAEAPIALCEVQGYVYAAYLGRAALAPSAGDDATGRRAGPSGAAPEAGSSTSGSGCPTAATSRIALDGTSGRSTRCASNMGHCLWSGIVDDDKAAAGGRAPDVARRCSRGWGVRTLATRHGRLQPGQLPQRLGLAARQRHHRRRADALRLRGARPSGSPPACSRRPSEFGGRLPELFCGFDRSDYAAPVPYPTSCSPQAWAAASPVLLLRTLLRLDPACPPTNCGWPRCCRMASAASKPTTCSWAGAGCSWPRTATTCPSTDWTRRSPCAARPAPRCPTWPRGGRRCSSPPAHGTAAGDADR